MSPAYLSLLKEEDQRVSFPRVHARHAVQERARVHRRVAGAPCQRAHGAVVHAEQHAAARPARRAAVALATAAAAGLTTLASLASCAARASALVRERHLGLGLGSGLGSRLGLGFG